ncbi:amidohydrolase [Pseudoclavibacter sp. CFCC 13611]|uniref:amidohydrolase n=1 Tax=Pseudoclavibacter sp. CFCC 13611 TaxID=2615178 RepID=UPI001300F3D6|nr:amidohydrolase [Pseudoclavibacter sp. CFCC 13611]KAB1663861.1 M20 family metallopeptidase [Pseudoclavibacter sp. CFCC 13611]
MHDLLTEHLRRRLAESTATDAERRSVAGMLSELSAVHSLSQVVHDDPETAFDEHRSAQRARDFLGQRGFVVEDVADLPTAFTAVYDAGEPAGSDPFTVAVCLEYDALPQIGHACGHNIILGQGLLTAVGLAAVAEETGIRVVVIGCPAEEHGGGKILLLEQGAFDDADIAIMAHPVPDGYSYDAHSARSLAIGRFRAEFTGVSAHAAAAPHLGRNANDAAVIAQVAAGLLRQQIRPQERMSLIARDGGCATNVISDHAVLDFEFRSDTLTGFAALSARVTRCLEGAAHAANVELAITSTEPTYEPLAQDPALADAWNEVMSRFGRSLLPDRLPVPGSTDMGNVSQRIPSLHPWVSIPGVQHPLHSQGFCAAADTIVAYETMIDTALGLTWAALASTPRSRE